MFSKINQPRKKHPILSVLEGSLMDLPVPKTISWHWNVGSLLAFCLALQILTGIILAMQYTNDTSQAFFSVMNISNEAYGGWMYRSLHANGASFFFVCLYWHIGRGLYYGSFKMADTWMVGVSLFLACMAAAFLGYVLPWGQMSYWGATVITGLFSAIPYLGQSLVEWIWGSVSVSSYTLTRFFALHFLVPFLIVILFVLHIVFLHETGSSSPLGDFHPEKIMFYPLYALKDIFSLVVFCFFLGVIIFEFPDLLGDPENYIEAMPMTTPLHIQPEWYYLFAYAILRAIPSKLGGVMALLMSVLILYTLPFVTPKSYSLTNSIKVLFWSFISVVLLLTWIGSCPVEEPYSTVGQILTLLYFSYFISLSLMTNFNKMPKSN